MKIRNILQTKGSDVIAIRQGKTVLDVCKMLAEYNIGVLLVFDSDDQPVGIISERDIVREIAARGEDCSQIPVEEVMTKKLVTATPDNDLGQIMNIMTDNRIRHLPVMEDEELTGIVSIGDVVKAKISETEAEAEHLRNYITGTHT